MNKVIKIQTANQELPLNNSKLIDVKRVKDIEKTEEKW